jgi:hypothetical protein
VSSQSFLLHHKKIMVPCNGKKERSTSTFNPFKVNYNVERWMIFKLNFKKVNKLKNWICSFTNFVQFYVVNNMRTSYIYKSLIEQIFILNNIHFVSSYPSAFATTSFFFLWQALASVFAPIKVYENIYLSVSYDFSKFDGSRKINLWCF